jgi:tRNA uridine 5-carboxymethylaminomethyl modification enzyme
MRQGRYQVVVIGGGHAGAEAAWAAASLLAHHGVDANRSARLAPRTPDPASVPARRVEAPDGASKGSAPTPEEREHEGVVALVTLDPTKIGVMSCNPAIGGLAKGQLVREVDAMGGLMGLAADASGIQFRVLNRSKGEAVRGPRAQCDRHLYARAVQALIGSRREIDVIGGSVERLLVEGDRIRGVEVESAGGRLVLHAPAVVLTTGTFMRGLMHMGESRTPGGRLGEGSAVGISAALRDLGFELGRLKTGTPPRLARDSIRWEELEPQWGDDPPTPFSDLSPPGPGGVIGRNPDGGVGEAAARAFAAWVESGFVPPTFPLLPQVECRLTRTTPAAHDLIRANLHRAPMYSGQIESVGPRYCPSIEDKVVRFAERDSHGVFLEPESLSDDSIYCNGISTSLPTDVQEAIVRSMPGCENARILRFGYAVEYDMVRPHQIYASGHSKIVEGLFLAGQINGTSGYEEAAAQGLIAGINAARFALGQGEFTLRRDQAYVGVLMDDLVTRTPVEPYRMFTSRAEHRLLLRPDNAADRLTPSAIELGLLSATAPGRRRREAFEARRRALAEIHHAIERTVIDGEPLARLIRRPDFGLQDLRRTLAGVAPGATDSIWETALAERRYAPFIERQRAEIRRHAQIEHHRLPPHLDYSRLGALRTEAREALARFRPATLGQAARLEGVTPADLSLLAILLKKEEARA